MIEGRRWKIYAICSKWNKIEIEARWARSGIWRHQEKCSNSAESRFFFLLVLKNKKNIRILLSAHSLLYYSIREIALQMRNDIPLLSMKIKIYLILLFFPSLAIVVDGFFDIGKEWNSNFPPLFVISMWMFFKCASSRVLELRRLFTSLRDDWALKDCELWNVIMLLCRRLSS